MTALGGPADDRLSAYLDGELSEPEHVAFLDAIAASADLQRELDDIAATRAMVRSLPPVEPPADLFEQLATAVTHDRRRRSATRTRRRVRTGAGALVAVAALWLLMVGLGWASSIDELSPDFDELALRHADRAQGSAGFVMIGSADVARMDAPVRAAGVTLLHAYRSPSATQFVYGTPGGEVSVFRQSGHLASSAMPADAQSMEVGGMAAYSTEMADKKVVVVDAGAAVLTVVGDMDDTPQVMAMASAVAPVEQDDSLWARTRRGWDQLTDVVGV